MNNSVNNLDKTNINWYPGHMAKANRQMLEQLKLVDIIIELRDARMPLSSGNPLLKELANNKKRLIILNKADKADKKENDKWINYFDEALLIDSLNENNTNKIIEKVKTILKDKLEKAKAKGIRKKTLRAMVVGIPNVGKSTFINNIVKKKIAKTENKPGVTRSLQWIRINEDVELLDTPGVLWPKIEDNKQALTLALLGSINDEILDKEELANYGLTYIKENYPNLLNKRYEIDENKEDLINEIARSKNCLKNNNEIDKDKVLKMILKDIRNNNIGNITFEKYEFNK